MTDGPKSSVVTEHAFEPRVARIGIYTSNPKAAIQRYPVNPYLCGYQGGPHYKPCNLAESAHAR